MNNVILDFEKLVERKANRLAREQKYRGQITPASSLSILCTGHDVSNFGIGELLFKLFK
ncbi:Putative uncharacterized protein [Lactobacillus equicursoris DSM 19284 = JCM 14600 = CIP 110162]|uniref:Uncharacterized protein n=1 Tax=Lactobacillus equicursoris DSM 19284 = JCM 14600 = CIP 110162 TaxID=1293597 RepID=K0NX69_9LACO|nr:hypothetical protein [Lactobacillus equicursoris]KRL01631.1 hypothetical protein FC20_GL000805 [Lactobacillus equicursoris DSM 19284 = JCM 14600 = CIP 110162]CCK85646.1 Putative uncharacterized protein [Lactobacillus equicursoris DSM 19284 = JCM 14600 = CIP 110162]